MQLARWADPRSWPTPFNWFFRGNSHQGRSTWPGSHDTLWSLAGLKYVLMWLLICGATAFVGLLCVMLGELASDRPIFIVAVPMLLAIALVFFLSPKALLVVIMVTRAGLNPFFESAQVGGGGGLGGMVNLAIIALTAFLVMREPKRIPAAAWWVWLPFLITQAISVSYSPDAFAAFRLMMAQVATAAVFYAAFYLVDDLTSFDKVLRLILTSSIPVAALTLIAIARGDTSGGVDELEMAAGRYAGPFPHPNILAFYTVLVIGILLYLLKNKRNESSAFIKITFILYMLLELGLLAATKTRSAWIAAAVLFLIYGLFIERRYLVYVLITPLLALLVPELRERLMGLGQGNEVVQYAKLNSFAWRQYIWESGLNWMASSHYAFGYGTKAFFIHAAEFFPLSGGRPTGAHNVYVQLFFDSGLIGLLAYLWIFLSVIKRYFKSTAVRAEKVLTSVFLAVFAMYMMVSASDNMLEYLIFNWYYWLFMGAVCSIATTMQRQQKLA